MEASIQDYEEGLRACAEAAKIWMQVRGLPIILQIVVGLISSPIFGSFFPHKVRMIPGIETKKEKRMMCHMDGMDRMVDGESKILLDWLCPFAVTNCLRMAMLFRKCV